MSATQCPECGGAGKVHVSVYNRNLIPTHERGNKETTWRNSQTLTGANSTPCRVCGGKGSL